VLDCVMPAGYQDAVQGCVEYVITIDSYCLDNSWDSICETEYQDCINSPGCMDVAVCNYDSTALVDDGSCTYPGCMDTTACNYDAVAGCDDGSCTYPGCMDTNACNYDSTAVCDDGSCDYTTLWFIPDLSTTSGPAVLACTIPSGYLDADQSCVEYVISIDPFCIDTSWDSVCQDEYDNCVNPPGCIDTTACNYDSTAVVDDGSCTYPGCMDTTACNYDSTAACEDGSCTYPGCIDMMACNYDSMAGCDDGSCILPDGCTDPMACNFDATAMCDDGSCMLPDGCTDAMACNYDAAANCDDGSCTYPGCTDMMACNYDSNAGCDDGSCLLPDGCTDPLACNYDSTAMCDDGSCADWPIADLVVGDPAPGEGSTTTYSYADNPGSSYNWTVTNGTIISGQGTSSIVVEWGTTGPGSVSVIETNAAGCEGDEVIWGVDVVTSVDDLSTTAFNIYPNPARDYLIIEPLNLSGDQLYVKLYDAVGKLVLSGRVNGKELMDIHSLSNGVYTVVLTGSNSSDASRIVIQR